MGKQDEWVRKTLRLPVELHKQLLAAAKLSVNAEIISRLERSFQEEQAREKADVIADILLGFKDLAPEDRKRILDLISDIGPKLIRRK